MNLYPNIEHSFLKLEQSLTLSGQTFYSKIKKTGEKAGFHCIQAVESLQRSILNHPAYKKIDKVCNDKKKQFSLSIKETHASINQSYEAARSTCNKTIDKIVLFLEVNKEKILFGICCLTTAFFDPNLFIPAAIATILCRVELNVLLRKLASKLKDEHNPYLLYPYFGPHYVGKGELALGVIAAVNAVAINSVYSANSWAMTKMIPILGGAAAGSCLAKIGLDYYHKWKEH